VDGCVESQRVTPRTSLVAEMYKPSEHEFVCIPLEHD